MKCPKCHYISFDYNQVCPKCSRDLTSTQKKMKLGGFKPQPPSFLGALTGDASDVQYGLDVDERSDTPGVEDEDLEMHLDAEPLSEAFANEEDFSLDLSDLELEIGEQDQDILEPLKKEDQGQTLDLGDLSVDEKEPPARVQPQETSFNEAERVTTEISTKKQDAAPDSEDFEIELDLEGLEDESS